MCHCDEGPERDRHADAVQQVEAEIQIAEEKAARAHAQLAGAALAGIGQVMTACDRRVMAMEPGEAPDTRTREERLQDRMIVADAMADASRRVSPDAQAQYLEALAFAVGVLMERQFHHLPPCPTEEAQYVAIIEAKVVQIGRMPWPMERLRLRHASERLWQAVHDPELPDAATWTARSARIA